MHSIRRVWWMEIPFNILARKSRTTSVVAVLMASVALQLIHYGTNIHAGIWQRIRLSDHVGWYRKLASGLCNLKTGSWHDSDLCSLVTPVVIVMTTYGATMHWRQSWHQNDPCMVGATGNICVLRLKIDHDIGCWSCCNSPSGSINRIWSLMNKK